MKLSEQNIFLFDGVGALLTAASMWFILPYFSMALGIPISVLFSLGAVGIIFAAYSLGCHLFVRSRKAWMLATMMMGNVMYCLAIAYFIASLRGLTIWGFTYFLVELAIIVFLVSLEAKIYRKDFVSK